MKAFLSALRRALRLVGAPAHPVPPEPHLASVLELLAQHGLKLAIVSEDRPDLQLSSRRLLEAAIARAVKAGEPEAGLRMRIARLLDRDKARVVRALAGAELDDVARAALEAHLLEPRKHPLPAAGRPPGRPPGQRSDAGTESGEEGKADG